jgi:poly [ADP-ribose] polymerase
MDPIKKDSSEFSALQAYARDTHGATHRNINVSIMNAYRVERSVFNQEWQWRFTISLLMDHFRASETEAWTKAGYQNLADGERLLLWHGSRTTNFAGTNVLLCWAIIY